MIGINKKGIPESHQKREDLKNTGLFIGIKLVAVLMYLKLIVR